MQPYLLQFYSEEYELCGIFMELPSQEDYPDYYQIIKHPIALENIKVMKA
jgi:hypothetical protein